MVSLTDIQRANAARASAGDRPFVAVFSGGTAGIGMFGVLALARVHGEAATTSAGLRVYIVGRRPSDPLLAECRRLCPKGVFAFVQAQDLSLLRDVDRVAAAIAAQETAAAAPAAPHVDLLVASQGVILTGPRRETAEGLERLAALVYYGRARLAERLLPLLLAAPESTGGSRVVSVLNPLLEGPVVADDLTLHTPGHFGLRAQAAQGAAMTTFWCEALAARHAGRLALVHWYPGAVATDLLRNSPLPRWAQLLGALATPLLHLLGTGADECGQRLLYLGTGARYPARGAVAAAGTGKDAVAEGADGVPGSGAYRVAANNDSLPHNKKLDADRAAGMADTVYAHTMDVFRAVEAAGVWKEE